MVRGATWRELRVLVTSANGPKVLEHVHQPHVYKARNCRDIPWTAKDVPLLHIGAAGKAVPLHAAWERDTGDVGSFAAALGCQAELLVGSWPSAQHSLCLEGSVELTMDFHKHQQSSFDSATALSKEASDDNLWKLKPKMYIVEAANCESSQGRAHTFHLFVFQLHWSDVLALARTNVHLYMWNLPEGNERLSVS